MAIRRSKRQDEPTLETFRVLYKNGEKDHIRAFTIRFPAKEADLISFFKSETVVNEEIFVRASEVASVIPCSSMAEAPMVTELQSQVGVLTARVDALEINMIAMGESLENKLANIVTQAVDRAVNAAFAARML